MNLEDYIKNLDPELQEKARACGSVKELVELARENKVPMPDEALAAVAGGEGAEGDSCSHGPKCPRCGSTSTSWDKQYHIYVCLWCGYTWKP